MALILRNSISAVEVVAIGLTHERSVEICLILYVGFRLREEGGNSKVMQLAFQPAAETQGPTQFLLLHQNEEFRIHKALDVDNPDLTLPAKPTSLPRLERVPRL